MLHSLVKREELSAMRWRILGNKPRFVKHTQTLFLGALFEKKLELLVKYPVLQ